MYPNRYDPLNNYGGMQPPPPPQSSSPLNPNQVLGLRPYGPFGTQILKRVYPIGSIYISTVSTNPGDRDMFGFGTWTAFGAGRVLVGVGTSDAAYAAAATGGESTHTLTSSEMPTHTHTAVAADNNGTTDLQGYPSSNTHHAFRSSDHARAQNLDSAAVGNAGSGAAHNNMPPYIVVYMWQRTA